MSSISNSDRPDIRKQTPTKVEQDDPFLAFLDRTNTLYIDKRPKSGCLWVHADESSPVLAEAERQGIEFHRRKISSSATASQLKYYTIDSTRDFKLADALRMLPKVVTTGTHDVVSSAHEPAESAVISFDTRSFMNWLLDHGCSTFRAEDYARKITTIENIIEANTQVRPRLYGCNVTEIDETARKASANPAFIERDKGSYRLLTQALDDYVRFVHEVYHANIATAKVSTAPQAKPQMPTTASAITEKQGPDTRRHPTAPAVRESASATFKSTSKPASERSSGDNNAGLSDPFIEYLKYCNTVYIDNRSKSGCLWIITSRDSKIIKEAQRQNIWLRYRREGSRATKGKPAYWTMSPTYNFDLAKALGVSSTESSTATQSEPTVKQPHDATTMSLTTSQTHTSASQSNTWANKTALISQDKPTSPEVTKGDMTTSTKKRFTQVREMLTSLAASYKPYFLQSVAYFATHDRQTISYVELAAFMVASAWYPAHVERLNFGRSDKLPEVANDAARCPGIEDQQTVVGIYQTIVASSNVILKKELVNLTKMVPYRLIRPFYQDQFDRLRSLNVSVRDSKVNDYIRKFNNEHISGAPYRLLDDGIRINPAWVPFFRDNEAMLQDIIDECLVAFFTKRNAGIADIASKLRRPDAPLEPGDAKPTNAMRSRVEPEVPSQSSNEATQIEEPVAHQSAQLLVASDSTQAPAVPASTALQSPLLIDENLPNKVLKLPLDKLLVGRLAAPLARFDILTVFDLTLFHAEEIMQLALLSASDLRIIESRISTSLKRPCRFQGTKKPIGSTRRLTYDEILSLDLPLSTLDLDSRVRRQLQRNGISTYLKVATTSIDGFIDCPGIDLETALLLEEMVGQLLHTRVVFGRFQGERPGICDEMAPLTWRLPESMSHNASLITPSQSSVVKWADTLPTKQRNVVKLFVEGNDERTIARRSGETVNHTWGILAEALMKRPRFREDEYGRLFSTYRMSTAMFCYVTQQPPVIYRYLSLVLPQGGDDPRKILIDKNVPEHMRERAKGIVGLNNSRITTSRLTLEVPEGYSVSSPSITRRQIAQFGKLKRVIDSAASNGCEYDIRHLFKNLKPNLKQFGIRSEEAFEDTLHVIYARDKEVSFPSVELVRFGGGTRTSQIIRLYKQVGKASPTQLSKEYEQRYGISEAVVRYWIAQLDKGVLDEAARTKRETQPAATKHIQPTAPQHTTTRTPLAATKTAREILDFLHAELQDECCDLQLVTERYHARFPENRKDLFDPITLDLLGYKRVGKKLLFRNDVSPIEYFERLISSHEIFTRGNKGFEDAIFNNQYFQRILREKLRNHTVVEYERGSYIALSRLCDSMDITPEMLESYSQDIARKIGRAVPFTIWSLRNREGITHPLDALATEGGVSDYLFESLFDIDPKVQTCTIANKRVFIVCDGNINAGNFLECVIEMNGPMEFDDLVFLLKDSYDIDAQDLPLHNAIRQSSLYYDDLTESVYNSKREWEEMVEYEFA